MAQFVFQAADLAPGEARSAALDLTPFHFDCIRSGTHPLFETAYNHLWEEFGAKDEMEQRHTLEQRFARAPEILYEMILVRHGAEFIAVRDHTAIVTDLQHGHAVVHLSHNLVTPLARRTGLTGWLRALPISTARECLHAHGVEMIGRITLAAEMESPSDDDPKRDVRLQAYERAGFRKIDPTQVHYYQPDFRDPLVIDSTGGARPLPFQLVVRRVGREHERVISGAETRAIVQALYAIYRPQFRPSDLAHPLLSLENFPADDATISLLPPTQC